MISLQEALAINTTLPLLSLPIENISIFEAKGRILAQDFHITRPLPAFDNSAMDGYAFNTAHAENLSISKRCLLAGEDATHITLKRGEALRIMTGAMLPSNADAIAPFEDTSLQDSTLLLHKTFAPQANIRKKGEEKQIGEILATKGTPLDFGTIGLFASQGYEQIPVFSRLNIGVFSTGNELQEVGTTAKAHQIYNINAPSIISALSDFSPRYLGILRDDLTLEKQLLESIQKHHIIITSGGVSAGDADLLEEILLQNSAEIFYHKINLKPGKPLMVARIQNCYFFCLAGNPLSAMLNLLALLMPAIYRLSLSTHFHPQALRTTCTQHLTFKNSRAHITLGNLTQDGFTPHKGGKYSPNAISTLQACNSFIITDSSCEEVRANQSVLALPYTPLYTSTPSPYINA